MTTHQGEYDATIKVKFFGLSLEELCKLEKYIQAGLIDRDDWGKPSVSATIRRTGAREVLTKAEHMTAKKLLDLEKSGGKACGK